MQKYLLSQNQKDEKERSSHLFLYRALQGIEGIVYKRSD